MGRTETKSSIITFNPEEGFLRVTSKLVNEIALTDAKYDVEEAAKLTKEKKVPVLVDSRQVAIHTKEVLDYYASAEVANKITAMAILVSSLATRMVGNFFIKTCKPQFPAKLFTDRKAAIIWLSVVLEKRY
jgi:hypothetical protein